MAKKLNEICVCCKEGISSDESRSPVASDMLFSGDPPYKVLFFADSEERCGLNVEGERDKIKQRFMVGAYDSGNAAFIGFAKNVVFEYCFQKKITDLAEALAREKPVILHLACHGSKVGETTIGGQRYNSEELTDTLAALVNDSKNLRLVILNLCWSGIVAQSLCKHVDFVIGHENAIPDDQAIALSESLYYWMGQNQPLFTNFKTFSRKSCQACHLLARTSSNVCTWRETRVEGCKQLLVNNHKVLVAGDDRLLEDHVKQVMHGIQKAVNGEQVKNEHRNGASEADIFVASYNDEDAKMFRDRARAACKYFLSRNSHEQPQWRICSVILMCFLQYKDVSFASQRLLGRFYTIVDEKLIGRDFIEEVMNHYNDGRIFAPLFDDWLEQSKRDVPKDRMCIAILDYTIVTELCSVISKPNEQQDALRIWKRQVQKSYDPSKSSEEAMDLIESHLRNEKVPQNGQNLLFYCSVLDKAIDVGSFVMLLKMTRLSEILLCYSLLEYNKRQESQDRYNNQVQGWRTWVSSSGWIINSDGRGIMWNESNTEWSKKLTKSFEGLKRVHNVMSFKSTDELKLDHGTERKSEGDEGEWRQESKKYRAEVSSKDLAMSIGTPRSSVFTEPPDRKVKVEQGTQGSYEHVGPLMELEQKGKNMSRVQERLIQNIREKISEMFTSERTQTKASDDLSNFVRANTPAILRLDSERILELCRIILTSLTDKKKTIKIKDCVPKTILEFLNIFVGWDVFYDICLGCVDEIQQFLEWIFDTDRFIGMINPSISIIREFYGKNILNNDLLMNLCRTCVFQIESGQLNPQCVTSALDLLKISLINLSRIDRQDYENSKFFFVSFHNMLLLENSGRASKIPKAALLSAINYCFMAFVLDYTQEGCQLIQSTLEFISANCSREREMMEVCCDSLRILSKSNLIVREVPSIVLFDYTILFSKTSFQLKPHQRWKLADVAVNFAVQRCLSHPEKAGHAVSAERKKRAKNMSPVDFLIEQEHEINLNSEGIPSSELFLQSFYLLIIRFPETIPDHFIDKFLRALVQDNKNSSEFSYRCHCWKEIFMLKVSKNQLKKEIWLKILDDVVGTTVSSKRCNEGALKFILAMLQKISLFEAVNLPSIVRFVLQSFKLHLEHGSGKSHATTEAADMVNEVDHTFDLLFDKIAELSGSFRYSSEWKSEKFGQTEMIDQIIKLVARPGVNSGGYYNHVKMRAVGKAILLLTSSAVVEGKNESFHDNFQVIHSPNVFFRFFFEFEKPQLSLRGLGCSRTYAEFLRDFHESLFKGVVQEDQGSKGIMREALHFETLLLQFERQSHCNVLEGYVDEPDFCISQTMYIPSTKLLSVLRTLTSSFENSSTQKATFSLRMLTLQLFELLSPESESSNLKELSEKLIEEVFEPSCDIYQSTCGLQPKFVTSIEKALQVFHCLHSIVHHTLSLSKKYGVELSTKQRKGIGAIFNHCKALITSKSFENVHEWDEDIADEMKSFNNRTYLFQAKLIALYTCKEIISLDQSNSTLTELVQSIFRNTSDKTQRNLLICFIWDIIPTYAGALARKMSDGLSLQPNICTLDRNSLHFFQRILHENSWKIQDRVDRNEFQLILKQIFQYARDDPQHSLSRLHVITNIKYSKLILQMKPKDVFDVEDFGSYADEFTSGLKSNDFMVRYEAVVALPILFARWDENIAYSLVKEAADAFRESPVTLRERNLLQILVYSQIAGCESLKSEQLFKVSLYQVCSYLQECPLLESEVKVLLMSIARKRGYSSFTEMLFDALPVVMFQWIHDGRSLRSFPHRLFCRDMSWSHFMTKRAIRYLIPVIFVQDKNLKEKKATFQEIFNAESDYKLNDCIVDLSLLLYILPTCFGPDSHHTKMVSRILQTAEGFGLSSNPQQDTIIRWMDDIFAALIDFVLTDLPISTDGERLFVFPSHELSRILLHGFEFLVQYDKSNQLTDFLLGPSVNNFDLSQSGSAKLPRILFLLLKFLKVLRNSRSFERKLQVLEVFENILASRFFQTQISKYTWVAQHCFLFLTNCMHDIKIFPKASKIMSKFLGQVDHKKLSEPLWRITFNNVINILIDEGDCLQDIKEDIQAFLNSSSRNLSPILYSLCEMMLKDSAHQHSSNFKSHDVISILRWLSGFASLNSRQASMLLLKRLILSMDGVETTLSDSDKSSMFRIAQKLADSLPLSNTDEADKEFIKHFSKFLVRFGYDISEKLEENLTEVSYRSSSRASVNSVIHRSGSNLDASFIASIAEELYVGLSDSRFEVLEASMVALSKLGCIVNFKSEQMKRALSKYAEFFVPFESRTEDSSLPPGNIEEQVINRGIDVLNPEGKSYERWIIDVSLWLIETYARKPLWKVLIPLCKLSPSFTEMFFPFLWLDACHSPGSALELQSEFGSHLAKYVFCAENENLDTIRIMLKTFKLFRAHRNQNLKKTRSWDKVYWFDVDYKLVGDAATRCGESLESILYLDFEPADGLKSNENKSKKLDYDSLKEKPSTLISISKAYEQSGEPDDIQALHDLRMYELDEQEFGPVKSWRESLGQFECTDVLERSPVSSRGLVDAKMCRKMHSSGFSKLSLFVATNELSQVDVEDYFEAAWRSEFWDLPEKFSLDVKSSAKFSFHASLFMSLDILAREQAKSLENGKMQQLNALLDQARFITTQRLKSTDIKVKKERENAIVQLRMCDDVQLCVNEFGTCRSNQHLNTVAENVVLKWESCYRNFNRNFELCEPLISMHSVLLRIFAPLSTSFYMHQCGAAKIAYNHGNIDYAKMIMQRLRNQSPRHQDFEVHTGIWYLRDAKVKWMNGENMYALRTLDHVVSKCRTAFASDLGGSCAAKYCLFNALRLKAKWMSDTEGSSRLSKLFSEAITLSSALTSVHRAKIHFEYASYLERMIDTGSDSSSEPVHMDLEQAEDTKPDIRDNHIKFLRGNLLTGVSGEIFLKTALENYLRCIIQCSAGKYAHDAVFHVLHLWFEHSNNRAVNTVISEQVSQIQDFSSFRVIACQLIMRLGQKDEYFRKCLIDLLVKFFKQFPHELIFELLFIASKEVEAAKDIIFTLNQYEEDNNFKLIFERTRTLKEAYQELASHNKLKDTQQKHRSDSKDPKEISPKLKQIRWNEKKSIPIPTALSASGQYEYVSRFENHYIIPGGITEPKKIVCISCNNVAFPQLVKKDDPNTDLIASQLFSVVNVLLKKDSACRERNLKMLMYKVIPIAKDVGLIEFVEGAQSLSDVLVRKDTDSLHARFDPQDFNFVTCRQMISGIQKSYKIKLGKAKTEGERMQLHSDMTRELRSKFDLICDKVSPVFRYHFLEISSSASDYLGKRLNYTRSAAASSMVGYIVGLGDRHLSNILIDADRQLLHIDLGQVFDFARATPRYPETVPFRLTRDMVDGMGMLGVEGSFIRCCIESMRVMRENKNALLSVIDILLYESNLERLSAKVNDNNGAEKMALFATLVRGSIKGKLEGAYGGEVLGIETQIRRLIREATDPENLCQLFHGWSAWI